MAIVCFFGLSTVVLFIALIVYLWELKPAVLCVQLTFNEADFRNVVGQWTEDGKSRFAAHFAFDYILLIAYGAFGNSLANELVVMCTLPSHILALAWPWLLPLAAVFDSVENLLHQRFLAAERGTLPAHLFRIAGTAAAAKWLLFIGFIFTLGLWVVGCIEPFV